MDPFDVLNMGNISNFHLDHSNRYLFLLFKFQDPFISPKKNSSDYMVYGTQNDQLELRILMQKLVWKICIESWDMGKNVSKFSFSSKMSKISYVFPNISGADA